MPSWEDKLTEEERCDLRRYRWITESIYRSLAASRRCVEAKNKSLEEAEALGVDHAHGGVCETCNDWASRLADITGAARARTEADFMEAE